MSLVVSIKKLKRIVFIGKQSEEVQMLTNLGYNLNGLDDVNYEPAPSVPADPIIYCPGGSCNWGCTYGCWIGCQNGCTTCSTGHPFGSTSYPAS